MKNLKASVDLGAVPIGPVSMQALGLHRSNKGMSDLEVANFLGVAVQALGSGPGLDGEATLTGCAPNLPRGQPAIYDPSLVAGFSQPVKFPAISGASRRHRSQ
jgi:hypothetical protein